MERTGLLPKNYANKNEVVNTSFIVGLYRIRDHHYSAEYK